MLRIDIDSYEKLVEEAYSLKEDYPDNFDYFTAIASIISNTPYDKLIDLGANNILSKVVRAKSLSKDEIEIAEISDADVNNPIYRRIVEKFDETFKENFPLLDYNNFSMIYVLRRE